MILCGLNKKKGFFHFLFFKCLFSWTYCGHYYRHRCLSDYVCHYYDIMARWLLIAHQQQLLTQPKLSKKTRKNSPKSCGQRENGKKPRERQFKERSPLLG